MSRTYSTQLCSLWDDPAFRALSSLARDTFQMLSQQPEIDAAGAMALTVRRWSNLVHGVADGLTELAAAGFVVIDEDTEEVLVVPFAESDGGYKHSKRVHAVIASANSIRSESLRKAAWKELERLGVPTSKPLDSQPNTTPKATDSATVVVTSNPTTQHPSSHNPQEGAAPSDEPPDNDQEPPESCAAHPRGTDKPCGPCGTAKLRNARWHKTQPARRQAAEQRRKTCPRCHGSALIENAEGRPIGKCDHRPVDAISGAGPIDAVSA